MLEGISDLFTMTNLFVVHHFFFGIYFLLFLATAKRVKNSTTLLLKLFREGGLHELNTNTGKELNNDRTKYVVDSS